LPDVTELANAKTEAEVDAAAANLNAEINGPNKQRANKDERVGKWRVDQDGNISVQTGVWTPTMARRVTIIDEIRGFCVLCMVVFHCLFILGSQFDVAWGTRLYEFFRPAQPAFSAMFILISGICARFSRDVRKRGFILVVAAAGITLTTVLLLPYLGFEGMRVWFGVIHLLAVSKLLFGLGNKTFDKIPSFLGLFICLGLFFFTAPVGQGYLGLFGFHWDLPEALYRTNALAFLGFATPAFEAFDHFPLLPYCFIFLFGTFMGKMIRFPSPRKWGSGRKAGWDDEGLPNICYKLHSMFFFLLGYYALPIYLLHVPVFYGLAYFLQALLGMGNS